jgi:hypothetical protein
VLEIRKTEVLLTGLMGCVTFLRGRECRSESNALPREILATSGRWATGFQNYGSITALAIGYISKELGAK